MVVYNVRLSDNLVTRTFCLGPILLVPFFLLSVIVMVDYFNCNLSPLCDGNKSNAIV